MHACCAESWLPEDYHSPFQPLTLWFNVADAAFPLHGVIKRVHILALLKHRVGLLEHSGRPPYPPAASQIPGTQVNF